jgi:O-antigen/teichoic acid export membrane protein
VSAVSLPRNVISNAAGFVVSAAIAFVMAPFLIRTLGHARYGAWAVIGELTGYYGLLDLGIRGAVTILGARYLAQGRSDRVRELISSAFWFLGTIAAAGFAVMLVVVLGVWRPAQSSSIPPEEFVPALIVMGFLVAAGLPMDIFAAVLNSARRIDLPNAMELAGRLVSALGIWLVVLSGGGLVGMSAVLMVVKLAVWVGCAYLALRCVEGISLRPAWARKDRFRELASFGSKTALINVARVITDRTDLIIIGLLFGVRTVVFYSIARLLIEYTISMIGSLTLAFTAHFAHLHAGAEHEELCRLLSAGTRVCACLSLIAVALLLSFGGAFIGLWVGAEFVTGPWTMRTDVVLAVLLAGFTPRLAQSLAWQVILASQRIGGLTLAIAAESIAKLCLLLVIRSAYGLVGIALTSVVPMLLTALIIVPRQVLRVSGLTGLEYLRCFERAVILGVAVLCVATFVRMLWPPTSWPTLVVDVGVTGLIALAGFLVVGLNGEERRLIWALRRPARVFA